MTLAVLFIMLMSVFALPGVSAQDDGDAASVAPAELEAAPDVQAPPPALEEVPDVPEPEPSPTPTLVPPTPEPTPTPTLEPAPTDAPVLTEPTQMPTDPAMPTTGSPDLLESTPAPEPTTTQASESVATPTTANSPALRSISVQSVIEGNQCYLHGTIGVDDVVENAEHTTHHTTAPFNCYAPPAGKGTIGISAPTDGWQYQIQIAWLSVSSGETSNAQEYEYDVPTTGAFTIYFGPKRGTIGCGQVTVTVTAGEATSTTTLEARTPDVGAGSCPSPGPAQCADIAGTPVTAVLVDGTLNPIEFSFDPRTVTGNMTIAVDNPQHCEGWVIDVSATDLEYTGPAPGQAALNLPAFQLRVVLPDASEPSLNTTQRLVSEGGTEASYSIPFNVKLDIPGGAAAGTYTSIITIGTVAAPGS